MSHVELNTPKISQEQLNEVENECNMQIRNQKNVIVHYLTKNEAEELEEVKQASLFGIIGTINSLLFSISFFFLA